MKCVFANILLLLFLLLGCRGRNDERIDDTVTPVETIFRYTVGEPLSVTGRDIEGGGHTWQGYSVYLRFVPASPLIDVLLKQGYTEIPATRLTDSLALPLEFQSRFSPIWDVSHLSGGRGFTKNVTNGWTHSGTHYFLIDEQTGVVYFHGTGA